MADLIERDALLQDMTHRGGLGIGDWHVFDVINEQPAVNRWISVEDALPEKDGEYLVFTEYEDVFKCTFDSNEENKWGFEEDYRDPDTLGWEGTTWTAVETVTHWMPLPEPPEKE